MLGSKRPRKSSSPASSKGKRQQKTLTQCYSRSRDVLPVAENDHSPSYEQQATSHVDQQQASHSENNDTNTGFPPMDEGALEAMMTNLEKTGRLSLASSSTAFKEESNMPNKSSTNQLPTGSTCPTIYVLDAAQESNMSDITSHSQQTTGRPSLSQASDELWHEIFNDTFSKLGSQDEEKQNFQSTTVHKNKQNDKSGKEMEGPLHVATETERNVHGEDFNQPRAQLGAGKENGSITSFQSTSSHNNNNNNSETPNKYTSHNSDQAGGQGAGNLDLFSDSQPKVLPGTTTNSFSVLRNEEEDQSLSECDSQCSVESNMESDDDDMEISDREFFHTYSQYPGDQEDMCRTLTQQHLESKSVHKEDSDEEEDAPLGKSFGERGREIYEPASLSPAKDETIKRGKITDYFQSGERYQGSCHSFDENRVEYRSMFDLNTKVFFAGETYCIRHPEPSERDKYFVTVKKFVKVGCKFAAIPETIYIELTKTKFLGQVGHRFMKSSNDKAVLLNGKDFLDGQTPIRLDLLISTRVPTPNPCVYYSEEVDAATKRVVVTFSRYSSDCWGSRDNTEKPAALELFSGPGGFSCGLHKFFKVEHAVDKDSRYSGTYTNNFPEVAVYDTTVDEFLNLMGNKLTGKIDHVHASPPCQGVSMANIYGGKNDALNNAQMIKLVDTVNKTRPKTCSMENVTGLLREEKVHYLEEVVGGLIALGYQVRVCILNAADYGDPQDRMRVFLFGASPSHKLPEVPTPTHGPGRGLPYKTCGEAIKDLENVIPSEGTGLVWNADKEKMVYNHWIDGRKPPKKRKDKTILFVDKPARTITRQNYLKHPTKPRQCSLRERARFQGFPDHHRFWGSYRDVSDMIGNAVPVGMATAVVESIRHSYSYALNVVHRDRYISNPTWWFWSFV